jgi:hypothetical protein
MNHPTFPTVLAQIAIPGRKGVHAIFFILSTYVINATNAVLKIKIRPARFENILGQMRDCFHPKIYTNSGQSDQVSLWKKSIPFFSKIITELLQFK